MQPCFAVVSDSQYDYMLGPRFAADTYLCGNDEKKRLSRGLTRDATLGSSLTPTALREVFPPDVSAPRLHPPRRGDDNDRSHGCAKRKMSGGKVPTLFSPRGEST